MGKLAFSSNQKKLLQILQLFVGRKQDKTIQDIFTEHCQRSWHFWGNYIQRTVFCRDTIHPSSSQVCLSKDNVFVVRLIYVMFCALKLCSEKKKAAWNIKIHPIFFLRPRKHGGTFSILNSTSNPSVFQLRELCFRSSGSAPLWKSSCTILSA